jgi:hypothetical protein
MPVLFFLSSWILRSINCHRSNSRKNRWFSRSGSLAPSHCPTFSNCAGNVSSTITHSPKPARRPLDAVGLRGPLSLQLDHLPVQLPLILLLDGRGMNHAPDLVLPVVPTNEHLHEFNCIETIRFGPSLTAIHLDAGGVDDLVLDSMGQQEAMQPETVASCLVATEHRSILRQAESSLGSLDLQDQAQSAAGGDRLEPRLLAQPDGEGQVPIAGVQIQSQVEHRGAGGGTIREWKRDITE